MDAIEVEGSEAIEVVAQFDGAIVDVAHIVRDDGADAVERHTRWLAGGGAAAFAVAAVAFVCAYRGAHLSRAVDALVAVCLAFGTWAFLRALDKGRFAAPRAYTIGPDPRASFAVAASAVPEPRFPLVRVDDAGDFVLAVAPTMEAAAVDGRATPVNARAHRLAAGTRAWVRAGGATFFVANVAAPRRQAMARGIDWRRELYLGGVTLVVSAFLFLVYAIPPSPASLALDVMRDNRFARFVIVPPQPPPPPPMLGPSSDSAAAGHAAREAAGTIGKLTAKQRTGQLKLPGPVSREKALAAAQASAQNAGILGLIRSAQGSQTGSIFRRDSALGDGADEILLGLQSAELRDGYGSGFDEVGTGPGGGRDGDHTIGSGPLGTVGFCRGAGCKEGGKSYVRSAPTADLVHHAKAPDIVPGQATVKCGLNASCLDKEIIRRVVHRHLNEVRYCYERALVAKPELTGRVVTAFTIAVNGRVLGASVTDSSLRAEDVESCITQAVRRWEFPSTQQMANVSYPFVLTPPR